MLNDQSRKNWYPANHTPFQFLEYLSFHFECSTIIQYRQLGLIQKIYFHFKLIKKNTSVIFVSINSVLLCIIQAVHLIGARFANYQEIPLRICKHVIDKIVGDFNIRRKIRIG